MSARITALKAQMEVLLNQTYEEGAPHQGLTLAELDERLDANQVYPNLQEVGKALSELVREGKLDIRLATPTQVVFDRPRG